MIFNTAEVLVVALFDIFSFILLQIELRLYFLFMYGVLNY